MTQNKCSITICTRMSIWQRFLYLIGLRPKPGPRYYELTESLQTTLSTLAEHEGRPEDELIPDLLAAGLDQYFTRQRILPKWASLSPREKDVAMLIQKGYTNDKIAKRLSISVETVKTHVANILRKFDVTSKSDLRHILRVLQFYHQI